jgi:hypothetical protein
LARQLQGEAFAGLGIEYGDDDQPVLIVGVLTASGHRLLA